jgi:phosphatidylserine/phosphatidylglycerophosphate/cardiolipin synthase-like enzyme
VSTSVTGRVIDGSGNGIAGLAVVVRSESDLFPGDLGNAATAAGGTYTVPIAADRMTDVFGTRQLGVYVHTGVYKQPATGPKVPAGRILYSHAYPDGTGDTLTVPDITLSTADVQGWPVSLPGTTNALPVRAGNALRPLVDDKVAWQHVADSIRGAQQAVSVMQLEFDLPHGYQKDATQESPEIILGFPDTFDGDHPPTTATDPATFPRPERLLLDAAAASKQVRVMLPEPDAALVSIILWLKSLFTGSSNGADGVAAYFKAAASKARALTFTTHEFSVIHAKAILVDAIAAGIGNAEGMLLGSPFAQSYWDTGNHEVYEARRGSCSGEPIPVHDVSIGMRGPVVADLQQQFLVHWNKDCQPADQVLALDPAPAAVTTAGDGEYLGSAQLVRTVNISTLPGLDDGEQGCLEAYLRAIEKATDYIYFENQYFTNQVIGDALIAALTDTKRPHLQVILMLNVIPDIPFYTSWQTNLVKRIRTEAGTDGAARFGVFAAWSHAAATPAHKRTKPVIMPNYLHTKSAIVDGKWATIGSANLDGASLDEFQLLRPFLGLNRNDELNLLVFNDVDDGFPQTGFVDALRIALWGEHLGIPADDPRLSAGTLSGSQGWLKLWTDCATAKLQGLIDDPANVDPSLGRVLAQPPDVASGFLAWLVNNYSDFLNTAKIGGRKIDRSKIDLITQTTAFSFHDGKWADA